MSPEDLAEVETVLAAYFKHKTKKEMLDRKIEIYRQFLNPNNGGDEDLLLQLKAEFITYCATYPQEMFDKDNGKVGIIMANIIRQELGLE